MVAEPSVSGELEGALVLRRGRAFWSHGTSRIGRRKVPKSGFARRISATTSFSSAILCALTAEAPAKTVPIDRPMSKPAMLSDRITAPSLQNEALVMPPMVGRVRVVEGLQVHKSLLNVILHDSGQIVVSRRCEFEELSASRRPARRPADQPPRRRRSSGIVGEKLGLGAVNARLNAGFDACQNCGYAGDK